VDAMRNLLVLVFSPGGSAAAGLVNRFCGHFFLFVVLLFFPNFSRSGLWIGHYSLSISLILDNYWWFPPLLSESIRNTSHRLARGNLIAFICCSVMQQAPEWALAPRWMDVDWDFLQRLSWSV